MTTLAIIEKAKKELEKALAQNSNVLSKALDTREYQAAQIGKAQALLDIAVDQAEADANALHSALMSKDALLLDDCMEDYEISGKDYQQETAE